MRENNFPVANTANGTSRTRVLIVDDDYAVRENISEALHLYNSQFDVATAANGYEAGEMVSSFKPDLILLNTTIETIDGPHVVKRIKGNKNTKHTKIVAFTSEDCNDLKKIGADHCVKIPVDTSALIGKLESLMNL